MGTGASKHECSADVRTGLADLYKRMSNAETVSADVTIELVRSKRS